MPIRNSGFTLIELSIVLIIIGMIVGGVLVGRDLIGAAGVRAQITQLEQIETAIHTFKGKYNQLPGDLPSREADNLGFYRTTAPNATGCDGYESTGCGNGDGTIGGDPDYQYGEAHLFWLDLSVANLISFKPRTYNYHTSSIASDFLPEAKLAERQYLYLVASGGVHYLAVSGVITYCGFHLGHAGDCDTDNIMKVADAYKIDMKTDDGLPQSGKVVAQMLGYSGALCGAGSATGLLWVGTSTTGCWGEPTTAATAPSSTSCYDNDSAAGAPQKYSMTQSNGAGPNCGLSLKLKL